MTTPNQLSSHRFDEPVSELTQAYTASVSFDKRLALVDIEASIAHAKMLGQQNIIGAEDVKAIERGMAEIAQDINAGRFEWSIEAEDVHMNIEKKLIEKVGDAGRRLHTGRSRNDQVATDMRLYVRGAVDEVVSRLKALQQSLLIQAEANINTIMPGFTHLQVAQPISFAHHMLAYFEMLQRDVERFLEARHRINRLPLGSAALAGTTFPIDRVFVAEQLGFEAVSENSLDAVSDRDFVIEFIADAALVMMHLSRLSEELILWMNPRFGFVDLPDRYCTTSSIMPQKKNPDIPELARGKAGRVYGALMGMLTVMKAQPLAYNKDNQEDKEPLFDSYDTVRQTLTIFADMMAHLVVKPEAMRNALYQGHASATDLADYLVRQGHTFREAHGMVAGVVNHAQSLGKDIAELSLQELQMHIPNLNAEGQAVLQVEAALNARDHQGGTAPAQIKMALERAKNRLKGIFEQPNIKRR